MTSQDTKGREGEGDGLDPAEQLGADGLWVGELELETGAGACLEDLGDLPFVTNEEYEWVSMGPPKPRGEELDWTLFACFNPIPLISTACFADVIATG